MAYVDGFVAAVPNENKTTFIQYAKLMASIFQEYGALKVVDTWGDDVPDGELTSFPIAVQKNEDEAVAFSWIVWASKEARDEGWQKCMSDPRMDQSQNPMPFDGKRIIFGGFEVVSEV